MATRVEQDGPPEALGASRRRRLPRVGGERQRHALPRDPRLHARRGRRRQDVVLIALEGERAGRKRLPRRRRVLVGRQEAGQRHEQGSFDDHALGQVGARRRTSKRDRVAGDVSSAERIDQRLPSARVNVTAGRSLSSRQALVVFVVLAHVRPSSKPVLRGINSEGGHGITPPCAPPVAPRIGVGASGTASGYSE